MWGLVGPRVVFTCLACAVHRGSVGHALSSFDILALLKDSSLHMHACMPYI